MNIILLCSTGSRKGIMSELLIEKKQLIQLSTGDLFRHNISNKTELGVEAQKYMNEGKYVPDSITNGMVEDFLKSNNDNLIFDGFPRTENQALALDEMLKKLDSEIGKVFLLDVDDKILFDRLTGRLICPKCKRSYHKQTRKPKVEWVCDFDETELITRADDAPEKISTRIEEYQSLTAPLIQFYEKQDKLVKIDCNNKTIDEMYKQIEKEF